MNYELVTLSPDDSLQTILFLRRAHAWASARPWAFPHSGGYLDFSHYYEEACRPTRKQIGVTVDSEMISLVTIELTGEREYLFHVTAPRRSHLQIIVDSTYAVGWMLFDRVEAELIYTHCPTISGHLHRGSQALCEGCGLRAYGLPEKEEIGGRIYSWQLYQMTRADWLENHHGRIEEASLLNPPCLAVNNL